MKLIIHHSFRNGTVFDPSKIIIQIRITMQHNIDKCMLVRYLEIEILLLFYLMN